MRCSSELWSLCAEGKSFHFRGCWRFQSNPAWIYFEGEEAVMANHPIVLVK